MRRILPARDELRWNGSVEEWAERQLRPTNNGRAALPRSRKPKHRMVRAAGSKAPRWKFLAQLAIPRACGMELGALSAWLRHRWNGSVEEWAERQLRPTNNGRAALPRSRKPKRWRSTLRSGIERMGAGELW